MESYTLQWGCFLQLQHLLNLCHHPKTTLITWTVPKARESSRTLLAMFWSGDLGSSDLLNMVPGVKKQDPGKYSSGTPSRPLHKIHMHIHLLVLEYSYGAAVFQKQPWHRHEDYKCQLGLRSNMSPRTFQFFLIFIICIYLLSKPF